MGSPETKGLQLTLTGFESIRRVSIERSGGQPRLGFERLLTGRDLLYTPLTLKFRGEVNRWLGKIKFPLIEVLRGEEEKMLRCYLWPQRGEWWSQRKVAAQMGWPERKAKTVSRGTKYALLRVWRRDEHGPWAVEILKLPWFLYRNFLVVKAPTIPDLTDIKEEDKIRRICGSEFGLAVIQGALGRHGVEWNPSVKFPKYPYRE